MSSSTDATSSAGRVRLGRNLVLYDGVCGLCNRTVRFLLRIDKRQALTFAPLQGATAKATLDRLGVRPDLQTLAFVREPGTSAERASTYSTGMLDILSVVGGVWRPVSWLHIVPRPLRDLVYRWVARNRYRWFGKYDECPLPAPEHRARFLP